MRPSPARVMSASYETDATTSPAGPCQLITPRVREPRASTPRRRSSLTSSVSAPSANRLPVGVMDALPATMPVFISGRPADSSQGYPGPGASQSPVCSGLRARRMFLDGSGPPTWYPAIPDRPGTLRDHLLGSRRSAAWRWSASPINSSSQRYGPKGDAS
jgi:hypothetical protein